MADRISVKPIEGFEAYKAESGLYVAVAEGASQQFGKNSQAYKTILNGINAQQATGSQFFFNTLAGLYLPRGHSVALYTDLERISDTDPIFFNGIYTDTSEIVLRTETASHEPNKAILENLVGQVKERRLEFSPENPLVISGVNLVKDDNPENSYGLLMTLGDEAIFRNDPRFASGKNIIPFGNGTKTLWTRGDGVSWVFLSRNGYVVADYGDLSNSNDNGRVVVVAPKAHAVKNEEFEQLRAQYQADLKRLRDQIDAEIRQ